MSNRDDIKFPVALAKEACPLCGKLEDGPIIIGTRGVKKSNNELEDSVHGKCIGYMKEPCSECKEMMKQGFLLIGVVGAKTDDIKNPYRSGNIWVVRNEAAKEMFGDISKGAAFIDVVEAKNLGFPDAKLDA